MKSRRGSLIRVGILALIGVAVLPACKSAVEGELWLRADAGPDRRTRVGEPLTFQGEGVGATSLDFTWRIASPAGAGGLSSVGAEASFAPTAVGAYVLSLTVSAEGGESPPDYVNVTVGPADQGPIAVSESHTLAEDAALVAQLGGSDPDGQPIRFVLETEAAFGSVSLDDGATGDFTYTPAADYWGVDSFTFFVTSGGVFSASATISLTITSVNDAPVADDARYVVDPAETVSGNLTATDVEADALTFTLDALPTKGTVTLQDAATGAFSFTATAGQRGPDTFSFTASDGAATSAPATITIYIDPASNLAPLADAGSLSVTEDLAATGTLSGSDPNSDPITFALAVGPSRGQVVVDDPATGAFTYTPAPDANGQDSFTFVSDDGLATSAPATITVAIAPVNDPPTASASSLGTDEDVPGAGTLLGGDVDGDGLTFSIVGNGSRGAVAIDDPATGAFTYTPTADVYGIDTFTFRVNDGSVDSPTATVTVTVNPVNDPPVATPMSPTVNEDEVLSGTLAGSDVDGDSLTFVIDSGASNGSALVTDPASGTFTYTPAANWNGGDSFTFTVSDGTVTTTSTTVTVTVNAVNDPPVASPRSLTVDEDGIFADLLAATDADGDSLTFSIQTAATKGTALVTVPSSGDFSYTPDPNLFGPDSFTFVANDGTVDSAPAAVSVTITSVNDLPTTTDDSGSVVEDGVFGGALNAADLDLEAVTFALSSTASNGGLTLDNATTGAFTYTPDPDWSGTDSFTFEAADGLGSSNVSTFTITVSPVNDLPLLSGLIDYETDPNVSVLFIPFLADEGGGPTENGQAITLVSATSSDQGVISDSDVLASISNIGGSGADGAVGTLTLRQPAAGAATITITISDDGGSTTTNGAFLLTAAAGTSRPIAYNIGAATPADVPVTVALKAHDYISSDPITAWEVLRPPNYGALSGSAPNLTYTPGPGFTGVDTFPYRVSDGEWSRNALARIVVSGSVAFIVGNPSSLVGTDIQIWDQLVAQGFTVTLINDNSSGAGDGAGHDLLIVSGSVNAANVQGDYTTEAVPVLTWERAIWDEMNMVPGNAGADRGTTNTNSVVISDPYHPLSAGLGGTVQVTVNTEALVWGAARINAEVAYTSGIGNPMGFLYIRNTTLYNGGTATRRRVATFVPDTAAGTLTVDGLRLVEAAIFQTIAQ